MFSDSSFWYYAIWATDCDSQQIVTYHNQATTPYCVCCHASTAILKTPHIKRSHHSNLVKHNCWLWIRPQNIRTMCDRFDDTRKLHLIEKGLTFRQSIDSGPIRIFIYVEHEHTAHWLKSSHPTNAINKTIRFIHSRISLITHRCMLVRLLPLFTDSIMYCAYVRMLCAMLWMPFGF